MAATSHTEGNSSANTSNKFTIKGVELAPFDRKNLIDRSTAIAGGSGSGKTFLVRDFINFLDDYIPFGIVICPSDSANQEYSSIMPHKSFIHTHADKAAELVKKILKRQGDLAEVVNIASDLKNLERLYNRIKHIDSLNESKVQKIKVKSEKVINEIKRNSSFSKIESQDKINLIESKRDKCLIELYKKSISINSKYLKKHIDRLDKIDKLVLQYYNVNPRVLIIFDDCSEVLARLSKTKDFQTLIFRGRHIWVTSMLIFHSDSQIPKDIIKNVFNIFLTDYENAAAFSRKKGNDIPIQTAKQMSTIAESFYEDKDSYKKLCYCRSSATRLQVVLARKVDRYFVFGNRHIGEVFKGAHDSGHNSKMNESNPFISKALH